MDKEEDKILTPKQRLFVELYVVDFNATQAAIDAGYSKKTATEMGYENLRKPHIKKYKEEIQANLAELAGVSALSNVNYLKKVRDSEGEAMEATKDKINAVKVMNEMLGHNAPSKSEVKLEGGVTMFEIPKNGRGEDN